MAFAGPIRDPVRNKWVVQFGMIACMLATPLAAVCGPLRGIPLFWMPIDMSFGIVGIAPLILAYRHIRVLEAGNRLVKISADRRQKPGAAGPQ